MTSIHPPAQALWWKQPLDRVEGTWIALALVWSLIMFIMMPLWHVYGKQNLSNEAYRTTPEAFMAKTPAMVNQYTVRTETNQQMPVVRPPPGSAQGWMKRMKACVPGYITDSTMPSSRSSPSPRITNRASGTSRTTSAAASIR